MAHSASVTIKNKQETGMAHSTSATMKEEEDRFDCLSDDILHRILFSFIDTRYAVKKCLLLSRRWSRVCKSLPYLVFDREYFPQDDERDQRFIDYVDMVLIHRDDSPIISYNLHWFNHSNDDIVMRNTNRWIHAVLQRKVQELSIDTGQYNHFTYELPYQLLNSQSLKKLQVSFFCVTGYAEIVLPDKVTLPNLEYLRLAGLFVSNQVLTKRLLSSCPLLDTLELHDCDLQTDNRRILTIDSLNLKKFELVHLFPHVLSRNDTMAKIVQLSAPNLDTFACRSFFGQVYFLENHSPLLDVDIEMILENIEDHENVESLSNLPAERKQVYAERVIQFIRAVDKVKCLKLSSGIIEVLSRAPDMPECRSPSMCNLQCLKIEMVCTRSSLRALAHLLKISPSIKSIFLISEESNLADSGDEWEAGMVLPGMSHLKFIRIEEVGGWDSELKVLEFLLRNTTGLMNVHLVFSSVVGLPEVEQFEDKVRGLPRASQSVKIKKKHKIKEA